MQKRIFNSESKKTSELHFPIVTMDQEIEEPKESLQKIREEDKKLSYKDDISIDKYALDDEWLRQPSIYMDWTEQYAQAIVERDKAKEQLELIRAELDAKVRLNPEKYAILKVTETGISSTIVQQGEYKDASTKLIEAQKNVTILGGVREALVHKKSALENLTKLFLENYYMQPDSTNRSKKVTNELLNERLERQLNE